MTKTEFINLISFCILMENDHGILDKAPWYVLEKWQAKRPGLLDEPNMNKLLRYKSDWAASINQMKD